MKNSYNKLNKKGRFLVLVVRFLQPCHLGFSIGYVTTDLYHFQATER